MGVFLQLYSIISGLWIQLLANASCIPDSFSFPCTVVVCGLHYHLLNMLWHSIYTSPEPGDLWRPLWLPASSSLTDGPVLHTYASCQEWKDLLDFLPEPFHKDRTCSVTLQELYLDHCELTGAVWRESWHFWAGGEPSGFQSLVPLPEWKQRKLTASQTSDSRVL